MERRKIMLVEDDDVTRIMISKMLQNRSYEVIEVASVPEAISRFSIEPVPVVL